MNRNIVKIIIIILLGVLIVISAILIFTMSKRNELFEWIDEVEKFYNENEETLNEFIEICFDNKINFIGDNEYFRSRTDICYNINDYFVYTSVDMNDEIKDELNNIFVLFKKYKVHDIYVLEGSQVTLGMGYFNTSLGLSYTKEKKSVEQIKKESFSDYVQYINDNWYIDK